MMLCNEIDKSELEGYLAKGWIPQLKIDGERCISNNGVLLARKRGNKPQAVLNSRFPHIRIENPDTIVDGEIAVFNDKGVADFDMVTKKEFWNRAVYVVFTVLKFEGKLLTQLSETERLQYLPLLKGQNFKNITEFPNSWKTVEEKEDEGLVIKNPTAKYEFNTRSPNWIKIKNWKHTTLTFNAYEYGESKDWKGVILTNEQGDRVACAGKQADTITPIIDAQHQITLPIRYLMKLQSGKYRHGTIKQEAIA